MRKNRVGFFFFFFFFFLCQIWAKNLLKFVFNGLKKHLHDLYMRFDCILPEFSPFRNFKKNIGKLNSLTVRKKKKKKKKKIPTDRPNFQILVGWGQHNIFFFGLMASRYSAQRCLDELQCFHRPSFYMYIYLWPKVPGWPRQPIVGWEPEGR